LFAKALSSSSLLLLGQCEEQCVQTWAAGAVAGRSVETVETSAGAAAATAAKRRISAKEATAELRGAPASGPTDAMLGTYCFTKAFI
jgi:hypothetical protein